MVQEKATPQKRDFKSSLFVNMFGRNINAKEHFLSLYNAIHGTDFKSARFRLSLSRWKM
ncbi:MAG: hypothetical protein IJP90_14890 [Treponema sp.]|nr:hypothetical protein [Treponema sp.]